MGLRLKKIHKQFLIVIGLFLFLTITLNVVPAYYQIQKTVFYPFNLQKSDLVVNVTTNSNPRILVKRELKSVWKIEPGEDRIEVQLKFRPKVDLNLPAKRILVQHGTDGWGLQQGKQVFRELECAIQNCELVSFPEQSQTYDARIFKEIDINSHFAKALEEQTPRHADQVWIIFALESPMASPNYRGLHHFMNWTATYRPDSTIVTPYDKWVYFDNFTDIRNIRPSENYAKNKTKLAAMFVSNCFASNNRLDFVMELKKHMPVDVYGACGDLVCERTDGEDCFKMLQNQYKFYLAFENANCRHYITEKFFLNALRNGVVPVVMGAHPDDYKRVAPIGSYIHVEDFNNAEELATYLLKLDQTDEEYNKYHRWRQTGYFLNTKFWCRICSMLWDPKRPYISVPDLEQWWRGNDTCIGGRRWGDLKKQLT